MPTDLDDQLDTLNGPRPDFAQRLESVLPAADRDRRRREWIRRARSILPLILLVGPILGWRLMLSSPDGVHAGIDAVAWLTFVLDVGVHLDTSLLSYLGLQTLPSIVGGLIFVVLGAWLLSDLRGQG